jgi:hypothetical protein
MHPSELKNLALISAAMAQRDGFSATAEAFRLLAIACAEEARELLGATATEAARSRIRQLEAAH